MKQRIKTSFIILTVGVFVSLGLAITKLYVGLSSNSVCIMLDATNSFFDILTGIVSIIAFAMLLKPRSDSHPFGFGRSEYVAGFVVAAVSAVVGGVFLLQSLNRLSMPEPVWFGLQNCILIAVAVVIKLGMALFYYFFNKKLKSKAIAALALDSFLDLGITSASLISFAISSQVNYAVDAIFGIIISIAIIIFAIKMVIENLKTIIGGQNDSDTEDEIKAVCAINPFVKGVGKIKLHDYGFANTIGTAEVEFDKSITLADAMREGEQMKEMVKEKTGAEIDFMPIERVNNEVEENNVNNETAEISVVSIDSDMRTE